MILDAFQYLAGALSGGLVGFSLGLFGGGGSILAVPLMVYFVGVPSAHMAIGTSAFSVAFNAATGLVSHARCGTVKWRCATVFMATGSVGAFIGASLGKAMDGQRLLLLFSFLMMAVGIHMFRRRSSEGDPLAQCNRDNAPKVMGFGAGTGLCAGFFGIGGGFLIVPGLVLSTGMPTLNAIGSSLVSVTAFGLVTAISYSVSGLVDWPLALVFVAAGSLGGFVGTRAAQSLAARKSMLNTVFATLILVVAVYMAWRNLAG